MWNSKPVLLVEDDRVDGMTIKRAFKDLNISNPLVHKYNGEEALEYLNDLSNKKPCIILLDINMPKMNGIEFLKARQQNYLAKKVPVVVLTTSEEQQDIMETFELGVAGYMVKPVNYSKFVDVVKTIKIYWALSQSPV